jgi:hypothetical protein
MSPPVAADQLLYTNVAARYSPAGRRGYQTVCASPGLSAEDRRAVEQQVGGMPEVECGVVRWQWFALADGRRVLSRSEYFPADAEVSDPRGAFLVHALVVSSAGFQALDGDPARLMDVFPFLRSARAMVDRFGTTAGQAPRETITPTRAAPEPDRWDGPELLALARLAAGAPALGKAGRSVLIRGAPPHVLRAVRLALRLAPRAAREHCSFDTLVTLPSCRPGQFWAVGAAPGRSDPDGFIPLDADAGRVPPTGGAPSSFENSTYARWLIAELGRGKPAQLQACLERAPAVQRLADALDCNEPLPPGALPDRECCLAVEAVAGTQVRARLIDCLRAVTTPEVGRVLADWLLGQLPPGESLPLALIHARVPAEVADRAFRWMVQARPVLAEPACRRLQELARAADHAGLALLAALWSGTPDPHSRDAALAAISADEFRDVLSLCPERIPATQLVTVNHASLLLDRLAQVTTPDRELRDCLIVLLRTGHRGPFTVLLPRLAALDRRSLRRLLRWRGDPWSSDPAFETALVELYQARERAEPWWNRSLPWPRCPRRPPRGSSE